MWTLADFAKRKSNHFINCHIRGNLVITIGEVISMKSQKKIQTIP